MIGGAFELYCVASLCALDNLTTDFADLLIVERRVIRDFSSSVQSVKSVVKSALLAFQLLKSG
jgi:hypothetical protein